MTEEIKAKLDLNGIKDLENYITNLQKENERLRAELNGYKLKCEKADEYINNYLEREYFDDDILETNTIYNRDLFKVKKILEGDDE